MLPHSAAFVAGRAPRVMGAFAKALGGTRPDPAAAGGRVAALTRLTGVTRLSELGVGAGSVVDAESPRRWRHPALQNTPGGVEPPMRLEMLIEGAL